jgi:NAD-dependent dihydropyrimidine dehydrogenase PreA subunit/flavodoxin
MNKDCIIICQSLHNGNTMKLARGMAEVLGCPVITATEALNADLSEYSAIGFGSGIYFGCHHPDIMKVAQKIDGQLQDIFIFSTRGNPKLGKYHEPLKKILTEKGKKITGEFSSKGFDGTGPFVIVGGGNKGKPNEKDIRKAKRFIRQALPQHCVPDYYLQIKSKRPVKEGHPNIYRLVSEKGTIKLAGDIITINQNECNGCGKCETVCPLNVLSIKNGKSFPENEKDCTLCEICIHNCRQRAITLHYNWRDAIKVAIRHGKKVSL